jgi:hypothetical protein
VHSAALHPTTNPRINRFRGRSAQQTFPPSGDSSHTRLTPPKSYLTSGNGYYVALDSWNDWAWPVLFVGLAAFVVLGREVWGWYCAGCASLHVDAICDPTRGAHAKWRARGDAGWGNYILCSGGEVGLLT